MAYRLKKYVLIFRIKIIYLRVAGTNILKQLYWGVNVPNLVFFPFHKSEPKYCTWLSVILIWFGRDWDGLLLGSCWYGARDYISVTAELSLNPMTSVLVHHSPNLTPNLVYYLYFAHMYRLFIHAWFCTLIQWIRDHSVRVQRFSFYRMNTDYSILISIFF
jgi:hypothetical protein